MDLSGKLVRVLSVVGSVDWVERQRWCRSLLRVHQVVSDVGLQVYFKIHQSAVHKMFRLSANRVPTKIRQCPQGPKGQCPQGPKIKKCPQGPKIRQCPQGPKIRQCPQRNESVFCEDQRSRSEIIYWPDLACYESVSARINVPVAKWFTDQILLVMNPFSVRINVAEATRSCSLSIESSTQRRKQVSRCCPI